MHALLESLFRQASPPQPALSDADTATLPEATRQALHKRGVLLAYASEMGFIDEVVETTRDDFTAIGIPTRVLELDDVTPAVLASESVAMLLTSTTGSGDAPFIADRFCEEVMATAADLAHLHYGLLCAGDSDYDEFCGFGFKLYHWLQASSARPLFAPVTVDDEDDAAVELWRRQAVQAVTSEPAHA